MCQSVVLLLGLLVWVQRKYQLKIIIDYMSEQNENDYNVAGVIQEHLQHWWREPIAGFLSVGIGCFDTWRYGRDAGLTSSLDEILVIGGIVLIAGSRKLFTGSNGIGNGIR